MLLLSEVISQIAQLEPCHKEETMMHTHYISYHLPVISDQKTFYKVLSVLKWTQMWI